MIGPPLVLAPLVLPLKTGWALMPTCSTEPRTWTASYQRVSSFIEKDNGGGELVRE